MKAVVQSSGFDSRITMVDLEGELDQKNCQKSEQVFKNILAENRFFVIVIMENVSSICPSFLGILMDFRANLMEKGGDLALVGLSLEIRERLNLVGADKIFPIYLDSRGAIKHLRWGLDRIPQNVSVEFPSKFQAIPALRKFASQLAQKLGFSAKNAFKIETMVDELANNAVEHGHQDQDSIFLELILHKDKIEILVRNRTHAKKVENLKSLTHSDNPPEGNAETLVEPSPSIRRGRGLMLVKTLSDAIDVSIESAGTSVKITKLREE